MRVFSALWLTLSLIIYCYFIPTWLTSTAISYLHFNTTKDMQEALPYAATMVLYPIVLISMVYLGWIAFDKEKYPRACIYASVPALLILIVWGYLFHFNLEFWWPWS